MTRTWTLRHALAAPAAAFVFMLGAGAAAAASGPVLAGSVSDPVNLSGAFAVAVSGHYAYTAAYYAGELTAVDISNPAAPVIAGHSAPATAVENADTVAIAGGYAYVVAKNRNASTKSNDDGSGNSLSIFDVHSNPAAPVLVGQVHDPVNLFGAYGVAISGHYAYVAAQGCLGGQPCPNPAVGNDVAVIDVSNPANPQIVAVLHSPTSGPFPNALHHADAVAAAGNDLYVTATGSNSLTVVSVANPLAPSIVAQLQDAKNLNLANDVAVQGADAYVADETSPAGGLAVVNIANPAAPRVIGFLSSPRLSSAYRIRVSGSYAYVAAAQAATIAVVNVGNPQLPALAATVTSHAHLSRTTGLDVAQSGRYIIATSPFLSTEKVSGYPPFPGQAGGPTATGTVSVIDTDPKALAVRISTPKPGGVYAEGVRVAAAYACRPSGPAALVSCSGPVAVGARIDTRKLGRHTFTVKGTDQYGQTGSATVTYKVIADPKITRVAQSARTWREHGRTSRRLPPVGTAFTFRLNEPTAITLTFSRPLGPGRIVRGKCVVQTKRNRRGHRVCERAVPLGTLTYAGRKGSDHIRFAGRLSPRRVLRPGTYTVTVTATVGGASVSQTLTFTIV